MTQDYVGLQRWLEFYRKDYKLVGRLSGRFFDSEGRETAYKKKVSAWIADAMAEKEKEKRSKKPSH